MKPLLIMALSVALVACGGAERKEEHRQKAEVFFEQGDFEKARLEYKNVVLIDPKDLEGHLQLARVQEKLGNLPTAVGEYRNVLTLDENNLEAKVGLGYIYAMVGAEEAGQYAGEILAADADAPDGLVISAMVAARAGRLDDALAESSRAMSLDPKHIKGGILLSGLYLQSEQVEEAVNVIKPLLDAFPTDLSLLNQYARLMWKQSRFAETISSLEKTLELEPDNLAQYAFLSGVYSKQGKKDEAEQVLRKAVSGIPNDITPKLMLVDFQLKEQGPDVAEKQLQSFISDTEDADLKLTLAGLYQSTGQVDKARQTYMDVIEGDSPVPAVLGAKNKLALMYIASKEMDDASALLEEILDESPKDQDALTLRGKIALSNNDAERAINDFRSVLKQAPQSVDIRRLLAQAQTKAQNLELALLNLQKASEIAPDDIGLKIDTAKLHGLMKQPTQARAILEGVLRKDPGNALASKALVALQLQAKDESGALSTLRTLQEKPSEAAYGHYLEGRVHQSNRDFAKSNASLERALIKQPGAIEPLVALVTNYLAEDNIVAARRVLNRALAETPTHVVARNLLGEIEMASGNIDKAEDAYRQVIADKPDWWVPYRNLSTLQARMGQSDAAMETMLTAVEKNPESDRLMLELALLQASQGHRRAAIESYNDMLKRNPDSIPALNNLAMLLVSDGSTDADKDQAKALVAKLPDDNPLMLDTKAWVLFNTGDTTEAVVLAKKALEAMPDSPDLNYHYALMVESQGDLGAALVLMEKAVANGARGFADLDSAKNHLVRLQKAQ